MLKRFLSDNRGYSAVDTVTGLVLLALTMVSMYQVMIPSFALWRNSDERIARQQDVRLAIDRIARELHESTLEFGRLRVYNCLGPSANQNCSAIGFVTARYDLATGECNGDFQSDRAIGEPLWNAVIYIWQDASSSELRYRCDSAPTPQGDFRPVLTWPPLTLAPYTVIGSQLVLVSFTLQPPGNPNPTSVAVAFREQATTASRPTYRYQTSFYNQTIFLPMNSR